MSKKLIEVGETAIQLARNGALKQFDNIVIRDHPDGTLVSFKFHTYGRIYLEEKSFSPKALSSAIRANFTIFERFAYRKVLSLIALEAIITFFNNLTEMTKIFPEKVYDEWKYLAAHKPVDDPEGEDHAQYLQYTVRRDAFLEFISKELLPSSSGRWIFPYDDLGLIIKPNQRHKIFTIFADIILKEIKRSIHAE